MSLDEDLDDIRSSLDALVEVEAEREDRRRQREWADPQRAHDWRRLQMAERSRAEQEKTIWERKAKARISLYCTAIDAARALEAGDLEGALEKAREAPDNALARAVEAAALARQDGERDVSSAVKYAAEDACHLLEHRPLGLEADDVSGVTDTARDLIGAASMKSYAGWVASLDKELAVIELVLPFARKYRVSLDDLCAATVAVAHRHTDLTDDRSLRRVEERVAKLAVELLEVASSRRMAERADLLISLAGQGEDIKTAPAQVDPSGRELFARAWLKAYPELRREQSDPIAAACYWFLQKETFVQVATDEMSRRAALLWPAQPRPQNQDDLRESASRSARKLSQIRTQTRHYTDTLAAVSGLPPDTLAPSRFYANYVNGRVRYVEKWDRQFRRRNSRRWATGGGVVGAVCGGAVVLEYGNRLREWGLPEDGMVWWGAAALAVGGALAAWLVSRMTWLSVRTAAQPYD